MTQRNVRETLEYYRTHQTKAQLGFDPDGQCLKVCRTARRIGPKYPSALAAQLATPMSKRVYDIKKIRAGMIGFFDDPKDDNPFGHIVTFAAVDGDTLDDTVTWTNSVKSDTLVRTKGSYFPQHWGDGFQFAATWLNGVDLILPEAAPVRPAPPKPKHVVFRQALGELEDLREEHRKAGNTRWVKALDRDIAELKETLRSLG